MAGPTEATDSTRTGQEGERSGPRGVQLLVFSTVITTISLLFFLFVGGVASLVLSPDHSLHWPYFAATIALTLFMMVSQIVTHIDHSPYMRPLYFASSVVMGGFMYSLMASIVTVPLLVVAYIMDESTLWTIVGVIFVIMVLLPVTWGLIEARFLRTRRFEVPLPCLGRKVKVAMISDVHLGLLVGKRRLGRVLSILERSRPDMIMLVGDLYDANPRFNARFKPLLARFASLAPTYAVFGNHEYFHGPEAIEGELSGLGIKVLRGCVARDRRTGIYIAGLDDPSFYVSAQVRKEKLQSLLRSVPEGEPVLLLDHQPLLFRDASSIRPILQLSGHTHAGQLWPAAIITRWMYKDGHRGLNKKGASTLFVCVGAGTWGPPMRVLAPPEMALFELVPG